MSEFELDPVLEMPDDGDGMFVSYTGHTEPPLTFVPRRHASTR